MRGLCDGKVRSTPMPKLTLRTVKVERTPAAMALDHHTLEHLRALLVAFDSRGSARGWCHRNGTSAGPGGS